MSFPLRPEHLAAMYDCFRQLPPFSEWKLPESDAIEFRTPARNDVFGEFQDGDPPIITVSSAKHAHTNTIILTLTHEMVHLAQSIHGHDNKNQHNADFRKRANRVCKLHGWDSLAY